MKLLYEQFDWGGIDVKNVTQLLLFYFTSRNTNRGVKRVYMNERKNLELNVLN